MYDQLIKSLATFIWWFILQSVLLAPFCLFGRFLGIESLVFSKFWHGARNPYKVEQQSGKKFYPQNLGKWAKNRYYNK